MADTEEGQTNRSAWDIKKLSASAKTILVCTIALILFLNVVMFFGWQYINELTQNPMVYGAQKIAELTGAGVSCSCVVSNPKYNSFIVTEEGITNNPTLNFTIK